MLRSRDVSIAVLLFFLLPSCSLLIDTNPDGVIERGNAGNSSARNAKSAAGAANGEAASSSNAKPSTGIGGATSSTEMSASSGAATNGGANAGAGTTQNSAGALPFGGGDASGGVATSSDVDTRVVVPSGGTAAGATTTAPGGTSNIGGTTGGQPASAGAAQGGTTATGGAPQCTIGSTVHAKGATNQSNECQICDPSKSTIEWSPGSEGKTCGSGQVCHEGACSSGCWINSKFYEVGAANPEDSCQYCTASSPNGWALASPCVARVFAPGSESCEIFRDGRTFCWGFYSYNATSMRATPKPVGLPTSPAVTQISGRGTYSCALAGTDMYCWGYSEEGIYGSPISGSDTDTPTPIKTPVTGVLEIASAHYVNCVRVGDGVQCAGAAAQAGSYGVLGDGTSTQGRGAYGAVSGLSSVTGLAAGPTHACAVSGGSVWCWGKNGAGELGDNSTEMRTTPVKVENLANVTLLTGGGAFTCAVSGGKAYCWGDNGYGQLGNNSASNRLVPVQVVGMDAPVTHIAAGGSHVCAIAAGKLYCWGSNNYGQLGDGTKDTHLVATPVPGFSIGVTDVGCGDGHTCAIKNGVAYCWGWNMDGQLGIGTTNGTIDDYSLVPVPVFVQR